MSYSTLSYNITEQKYNYLIPVLRNKLLARQDGFKFIGSKEDFEDALNRCKYLDEDLANDSPNYREILAKMVKLNKTVRYKQIHH